MAIRACRGILKTKLLDTKCRDQILFVVTTPTTFFKDLVDYLRFRCLFAF